MRTVIAVIAGFVAAAAVMMGCEYANSLLYPFPADLDTNDISQVRAFAASMPLSALVLVAIGWTLGSILGGAVATRLSGAASAAIITGVLLTAMGALNAWMIQNPLWFHLGGLPIFMLGATIGEYFGRPRG
jgi:hypothetical protein